MPACSCPQEIEGHCPSRCPPRSSSRRAVLVPLGTAREGYSGVALHFAKVGLPGAVYTPSRPTDHAAPRRSRSLRAARRSPRCNGAQRRQDFRTKLRQRYTGRSDLFVKTGHARGDEPCSPATGAIAREQLRRDASLIRSRRSARRRAACRSSGTARRGPHVDLGRRFAPEGRSASTVGAVASLRQKERGLASRLHVLASEPSRRRPSLVPHVR